MVLDSLEDPQPEESEPGAVFSCGICFTEDIPIETRAILPCCGRKGASSQYCHRCIEVIIERGSGRSPARCPSCRAGLSLQDGQFANVEDDEHGDYEDAASASDIIQISEEEEEEEEDQEFEDDGSDIKVSFSVKIRASEDEWFEDGKERFKEMVAQIAQVEVEDVDVIERRRPSGRSLKVKTTITIDRSTEEPDSELEQIESDAKEFLDRLDMFEEEMADSEFEVLSRSRFVATCGDRVLRLEDADFSHYEDENDDLNDYSEDEEDEEGEEEGEDEDEDQEFEDDGSDIKVSFSVQIRMREDEWFEDGEERFKEAVARIAQVEVEDVDVGEPIERRRPSGRSLKVKTTITIDRSTEEPDSELGQIESDAKEFLDRLDMFEDEMADSEFEVLSRSRCVATCGDRVLRLQDQDFP